MIWDKLPFVLGNGKFIGKTIPVKSYPKNIFGLYDMTGNVAEFTSDLLSAGYLKTPRDGSANENYGDYQRRAVRGCSFKSTSWQCRLTFRDGQAATMRSPETGLR